MRNFLAAWLISFVLLVVGLVLLGELLFNNFFILMLFIAFVLALFIHTLMELDARIKALEEQINPPPTEEPELNEEQQETEPELEEAEREGSPGETEE